MKGHPMTYAELLIEAIRYPDDVLIRRALDRAERRQRIYAHALGFSETLKPQTSKP